MRENGGFENYEIIPVSFHNLTNIVELRILEQQEMDKYDGLLNSYYASRPKKQYRIDNIEKKSEYDKQYRIDNQEIIKKKKNEKIPCDCGCIVSRSSLPRHKKSKKHLDLVKISS